MKRHPIILRLIYKTRLFRWWLRRSGRGPEFVPQMLSDNALKALESEIKFLKEHHQVEVNFLKSGEIAGKPAPASGVEPPEAKPLSEAAE